MSVRHRSRLSLVLALLMPAMATAVAQQPAAPAASAPARAELTGKPADDKPSLPPINMPPMTGKPSNPAWEKPIQGERFIVEKPFYHFGDVWQNVPVTHEFVIKNTSDLPLRIAEVKADCHCTTPGDFIREIPPHGEGKVPFTLMTAGLGNMLTKGATIQVDDPKVPEFRVMLEGFIKTILKMTPNDGGSFGQEVIFEDQVITHKIILESLVPEPLSLWPMDLLPNYPWNVEFIALEPGRKWQLNLSTKPPLPAGFRNDYIRFKTGHKDIPVWYFIASYFRPERIAAKPINLRFPDAFTAGQPVPSVEIINNGAQPVRILGVEVADPALVVRTEMIAPGKQFKIEVEPPANYALDGSMDLIVRTDDPQYKEIKVPIWSMASRGKTSKWKIAAAKAAASAPAAGATPAAVSDKAPGAAAQGKTAAPPAGKAP